MLLFCLDSGSPFGQALADSLDVALSPHEERHFADGERKLRPLVDPRGCDAYVVHGLHGGPHDSPHDKLCRLLMFIATLRDHGAARVTAVVPYLAYARKDERTKLHDPLGLRYVAQLLEAMGVAQLIVLEAHNVAALQSAFRCPVHHLDAHAAFRAFAAQQAAAGALAVASPDPGGVKRALRWRESLEAQLQRPVGFAMVDKRRSGDVVSGPRLVAGSVDGATVLLYDDLVASGETLLRAASALRDAGARRVVGCAAHGLFVGDAPTALAGDALDAIAVTDSVPHFRLPDDGPVRAKLQVLTAVPLFADAIRASHASWWT